MPEICDDKAKEHRGKDVGNEGVIHRNYLMKIFSPLRRIV